MYEVFEHTADLGLRVRARDLPSLFADAAQGLFSLIVANVSEVQAVEERSVRVSAGALDFLLFDWLCELLYLFETEHLVFAQFDVRIEAEALVGTARGEKIDPERHHLEHEVKAITYHGLKLEPCDEGWLAEVIVDI